MNRSDIEKAPSLHLTQDDYDRLASEARDKVFEAFKFWREAVSRASFNAGWDRGWQRGWDSALIHMKKNLEASAPSTPQEKPQQPSLLDFSHSQEAPAADRVLDYINQFPGKRGIDIANHFATAHPPIPERTIRTALHRMKNKKITIVDGAWHPLKIQEVEAGP